MSEDEKPKLGLRPQLGVKRTTEVSQVKQSFSHGRTHKVVVETKKARVFRKPGDPAPASAEAELADEVLTAPGDFEAVRDALQAAGLTPDMAEVTMRPENTIALEGDDAARMQKLLDMIEDLDDVQDVYHNAEL